jgi:hypothetical protein
MRRGTRAICRWPGSSSPTPPPAALASPGLIGGRRPLLSTGETNCAALRPPPDRDRLQRQGAEVIGDFPRRCLSGSREVGQRLERAQLALCCRWTPPAGRELRRAGHPEATYPCCLQNRRGGLWRAYVHATRSLSIIAIVLRARWVAARIACTAVLSAPPTTAASISRR